ncbi:hypothetical protein ICV01_05975 [Polynucleobacter sp. MWH-Spelu-300-X4]|nr:hypothetical protein [Polynucleobacter sp. MWH-Spelu-300-X4]QWD79199.1 hypothetical protein ICV01_05975 [Polynucleobacter sp. MWH-Spelu-300-X4]
MNKALKNQQFYWGIPLGFLSIFLKVHFKDIAYTLGIGLVFDSMND